MDEEAVRLYTRSRRSRPRSYPQTAHPTVHGQVGTGMEPAAGFAQSVLINFRGIRTVSFGTITVFGPFLKMIGSLGMATPVSVA
jgi:hypothetical protein